VVHIVLTRAREFRLAIQSGGRIVEGKKRRIRNAFPQHASHAAQVVMSKQEGPSTRLCRKTPTALGVAVDRSAEGGTRRSAASKTGASERA
jgi:hypothetical protein